MTVRDISITMGPETPEWPGDTPFRCGWTWSIAAGATVNVSVLTTSPHVGTHADAPVHVSDGWPASDALPLEPFIGPAVVRTVEAGERELSLSDLGTLPRRVERLLLQTGCSIAAGTFPGGWPALSLECLHALLERGLTLLGVDAPSVDLRRSDALAVHRALFAGGAHVLENLDLRGVDSGEYELVALPLKLDGLDAAPVRAALRWRA